MTVSEAILTIALFVGASLATALAILALPVVRAARSRPRRQS